MYYQEHRESILIKVKAYRESHKEQIREYKKRYEQTYVRDIEKTRALERARYNPEKRRETYLAKKAEKHLAKKEKQGLQAEKYLAKKTEKHLAKKEKQGLQRAAKKENKKNIEENKRMEILERNKQKWLEHEKREQLKAELNKIRTEVTYEHEGKLYYNFYILRRIKSSLQSRESSVSAESFSKATP